MPGLTSGMNPNVTKTALDTVFYQRYAKIPGPQIAFAGDEMVFQQENSDRAAEIQEVFKGTGIWQNTPEQAEYKGDTPFVNDQITFTHAKYTSKFHITEEMMEDDLHSLVRKSIAEMGTMANVTQNKNAMGVYRNADGTTLTADAVALLSASHTNINGDTIDNTISATVSVDTVEEAIKALLEQKNQAGVIVGHEAKTMLVSPDKFKEASEILESKLEANTTDNNMNVYSAKYGIVLRQSQYLGAAAGDGGKDDRWFMMGEYHSVMRFKRIPVQTRLLDGSYQENGDSVYRGRFRESYGAVTYEALVGYEGA
jgi:hypothetical protein